MEIVQYDKRYKQDFIDLNTHWITGVFGGLEKEDLETFKHVEDEIAKGGMVFFAVKNEEVMAACMTRNMGNGTWELCKLAANPEFRHQGAGKAVFETCMNYAIKHDAQRLFMISNSRLKAALHIYEEYGFQEVKLDDYEYERGDIAFEYLVNSDQA